MFLNVFGVDLNVIVINIFTINKAFLFLAFYYMCAALGIPSAE